MVDNHKSRGDHQLIPFSDGETYNFEYVAKLTMRELQCLLMAANDKTTKETAKALFLSPHTVRAHRSMVLEKLDCKTLIGAFKRLIEK